MIEPHGGKLITKFLSGAQASEVIRSSLCRMPVENDAILDLEKIAIGAYSPLTGFMMRVDVNEVIHRMKLGSGASWTIPVVLPIARALARTVSCGQRVVLCEKNGREVGLIKVEDIFSFNKRLWARKVFGTENAAHPGVKRLFDSSDFFIGGQIWLIKKPDFEFEKFNCTPQETRTTIREYGWKTVAGFQTRNVPHRAHEYLQKLALSVTDGILIHPIIGWKKDGDFAPQAIIHAYKALIKYYYPKKRVIFAGLATAMRYAGPREAVFHAIIRKNYGCTHFIVGRDHAGVGDFYGKYDAHKIFDSLPDLGVTPLLLREPYYCRRCKEIVSDKICPHGVRHHQYISGTMLRELIRNKKEVPEYMMRREVSRVLQKEGLNHFV